MGADKPYFLVLIRLYTRASAQGTDLSGKEGAEGDFFIANLPWQDKRKRGGLAHSSNKPHPHTSQGPPWPGCG